MNFISSALIEEILPPTFKIWVSSFDAVTTISSTRLALAYWLNCINGIKIKIKKYIAILVIFSLSILVVLKLISLLAL